MTATCTLYIHTRRRVVCEGGDTCLDLHVCAGSLSDKRNHTKRESNVLRGTIPVWTSEDVIV